MAEHPSHYAFDPAERAAVYRAILERRDMRHFAGGAVPDAMLVRLLTAAHHAPSVGFMQPLRFIRIGSQGELRTRLHALVEQERRATPMLEMTQWAPRQPLCELIFDGAWGQRTTLVPSPHPTETT